MVKVYHSVILFSAAHALGDAEVMMQVGKFDAAVSTQTDSQTSRHHQALQMVSNFEKLAAEAVRTGETPSLGTDARSAVDSALDTLEGELKKEKIANDAEMVGANTQCAACNTAQKDAFTKKGVGVDAFALMVEQTRSKHASCRGSEDTNCGDEKTTCVDQDNYAEVAHGVGPQCPCKAYDTADLVKDCLQKALDWGNKYNTVLGDKIQACDKAKAVAKTVAKKCDKDQTEFEMAFCSYEVSITTTCESHSACYEAAMRNRAVIMTNLKMKEASEKVMWKSCKKVRCYLDMLKGTQVSQEGFDKCKKQEADVKHLDVTYGPAPVKIDCDTTPVQTVPGDAAWLKAEYAKLTPKQSWLPKRNGIEKVSPCPVVKPQPAPVCDKFFGPGAAAQDQIVSIVDVDLPKFYCDLFGKPAPCTFIHRSSAAGGCGPPGPADACHSYHKVVYSKCDGLDAMNASQPDVQGRFDSKTGVFKGCEGFVTSSTTYQYAPETPYKMTYPPTPPANYKAIKCSK